MQDLILFLHQARFEFAALGLDNSWVDKELEYVRYIERDFKYDAQKSMDKVYEMYDSSIIVESAKTTKPEVLINLINDEGVDMGEDAKSDIRNNKFKLTLIADLAEDTTYKTVYFDEYEWNIVYTGKAKDSWDSNDDFNSDPGQALTEG